MNIIQKLLNFLQDARAELRKVVWPTREEAIRYTIIVIAISVGVALFLGAFDYIFHFILNRLIP